MHSPKLISLGTSSINMTPMIDVVFLLIIFFLVSSHLAKQESHVPLQLPTASSGIDDIQTRPSVVVNVLPEGTWMVAGVTVDQAGLDRSLRSRAMIAEQPLQLRIRTDKQIPYQAIEPVLRSAAQLGITDVVFSVYEERRP